jgi:hypothetical protein
MGITDQLSRHAKSGWTLLIDARGDSIGIGFAIFQVKNGVYVQVE